MPTPDFDLPEMRTESLRVKQIKTATANFGGEQPWLKEAIPMINFRRLLNSSGLVGLVLSLGYLDFVFNTVAAPYKPNKLAAPQPDKFKELVAPLAKLRPTGAIQP